MSAHSTAAQIKSHLDHPIIDADGHWVEYGPVFTEQLRTNVLAAKESKGSSRGRFA